MFLFILLTCFCMYAFVGDVLAMFLLVMGKLTNAYVSYKLTVFTSRKRDGRSWQSWQ